MATLIVTADVESKVAHLIADSSTPSDAAIQVLHFLRTATTSKAPSPIADHGMSGRSLYDALAFLKRNVPSKTLVMPFKSVVIQCAGGVCTLTAHNFGNVFTAGLSAPQQPDIETTIEHKLLFDTLRGAKTESHHITFSHNADGVTVVTIDGPNGTSQITGDKPFPLDEYPVPPAVSAIYSTDLDLQTVADAAMFTKKSASYPTLRSVLFAPRFIAAADGFRLFRTPWSGGGQEWLVDREPLISFTRFVKTDAQIVFGEKYAVLSGRSRYGVFYKIVTCLTDGTFLDVQRLIPERFTSVVHIERADLLRALKMTPKKHGLPIALSVSSSETTLIVDTDDNHSTFALTTAEPRVCPSPITIGLDRAMVEDIVSSLHCDEIAIHLNTPTQPAKFTAGDKSSGENTQCILMPMFLKGSPE